MFKRFSIGYVLIVTIAAELIGLLVLIFVGLMIAIRFGAQAGSTFVVSVLAAAVIIAVLVSATVAIKLFMLRHFLMFAISMSLLELFVVFGLAGFTAMAAPGDNGLLAVISQLSTIGYVALATSGIAKGIASVYNPDVTEDSGENRWYVAFNNFARELAWIDGR